MVFELPYTHTSPTLSLRWPSHARCVQGIARRMPQVAHFLRLRASWCVRGSGLRRRVDGLIHSLPGKGGTDITTRLGHSVVGTGDLLSVEHGTEMLDHINVHTGPRHPGLAFRIKQPFVARTVGDGHSSFPSLGLSPVGTLRRPLEPGDRPNGRGALVTEQRDDLEPGGIGRRRGEAVVVPADCVDLLLRRRHLSLRAPTKDPLRQTAIAQRHIYTSE